MSSSRGWTSEKLSSHSTLFAKSLVKREPAESMSESTKPSTATISTEESTMKSESKKKKFYVGMKRESVTSNSNIKSKKRGKIMRSQTTEAEDMLENTIEGLDNVEEARIIQRRLALLKEKVDSKVHTFEKSAEKDGLSYKGDGAMKCSGSDCDNSFDPEGEYFGGVCTGCSKRFCIECHDECGCGKVWCWDCRQECCGETICKGCCHFTCKQCEEPCCEDCLREVGNHMHTLEWCISCERQSRSRW